MEPAHSFDQPAGRGVDEGARHRRQAGEQGELRRRIRRVRGARNEGHKGRRPQADAKRLETDHERQRQPLRRTNLALRSQPSEPREAEDGDELHDAEQPQRAIDPETHHPQAAEQTASHRWPQSGVLGDQADIGLGEAHVEVERRRQRGAQGVAQLVEEDEGQDQQRAAHPRTRHELVKRLDDGFAQRPRAGAGRRRLADEQNHHHARNHERGGDPEDLRPGEQVGEDQGQRAGHQAGDAVGIDVHRVAQPKFDVGKEFAPVGVERDVLRSGKQGQECGQPEYRSDVG